MGQFEDMRLYVEVIRDGNFSTAAERLGVSKQFVSRRIAALEARLGVRLLNRTTRRLNPTVLGLEYHSRASAIVAAAEEADHAISSHSRQLKGRLRLTVPLSYGLSFLPGVISAFTAQHPEAEIDLSFSDRYVDLVREGYDLAVRIGVLADSSLVIRRLAAIRFLTVASPAYLARRGEPETPEALQTHACLLYGHGRNVRWRFRMDKHAITVAVQGRLLADNGDALAYAAAADGGIVQLPRFIVAPYIDAGHLQAILQDFEPRPAAAFAVYPQHRQNSALGQAFIAAVRKALESDGGDSGFCPSIALVKPPASGLRNNPGD
ncbi:MAG: LysR family transcriptional regulator [Candidatus Accumulibacter sp.]|jgi:DNA-binding transcriptional LysR family regulator|nr:LysR family transcriptional regulator [Accumulibacter sp.]